MEDSFPFEVPMIRTACLAALLASTGICLAQTPAAPGPNVPVTMPEVPKATCVKPELPRQFADNRRLDRFNKEYHAYGDCVKKYIDDTNALASNTLAQGKTVLDEFNAFNAELKEYQETKK
jgi:hypothetical protein